MKMKCTLRLSRENSKSYGITKKSNSSKIDATIEFTMLENSHLQVFNDFGDTTLFSIFLIFILVTSTLLPQNNCINGLRERALSLVYNDFSSSFSELLEEDKSVTIHHLNLKALAYLT